MTKIKNHCRNAERHTHLTIADFVLLSLLAVSMCYIGYDVTLKMRAVTCQEYLYLEGSESPSIKYPNTYGECFVKCVQINPVYPSICEINEWRCKIQGERCKK